MCTHGHMLLETSGHRISQGKIPHIMAGVRCAYSYVDGVLAPAAARLAVNWLMLLQGQSPGTDPSKFTSMQDYAGGYPKAFVTRRLVTFVGIVIG